MPRGRKRRICRRFEGDRVFKPRSVPMTELATIEMGLDELEALRLCDLEGHDQEGAGARMGVSRGTVQRLLRSARTKTVRAFVESSALVIQEGDRHEIVHPDDD